MVKARTNLIFTTVLYSLNFFIIQFVWKQTTHLRNILNLTTKFILSSLKRQQNDFKVVLRCLVTTRA